MKIQGKVETIIYRNEGNCWTVMLLKVGKEYLTSVGLTEEIEVGDELELEGIEDTHKVYGLQFKFTTYKKVLPKTNSALINYIADNIKGVGKKTARNIIDRFGDNTVNVIRNEKDKLYEIKGLNGEKIESMSNFFNEEYEKWNTIEYLAQFQISVVVANRIYQALGSDTIDIVKNNPYSLLNFVKSLNFNVVDEIGKQIGISLDNEDRLEAGIIYAINKVTEFGHTCVETDKLIDYAASILEVDSEQIHNVILRLKLNEELYTQIIDSEEYIFRRSYYLAEKNIADNVIVHSLIENFDKDYKKELKRVSKENNIELSEEQKKAILTCLNSSMTVITGGPGTGKTTIIKCIIDILESIKKTYVLCAPTGRAAKRITQTTNKEAKTIHRLLEISKIDENDLDAFIETNIKLIDQDVVIIDEASMIDCLMMNNLFRAIKPTTQVIMVGDINQLPSVGPGNVLKDIIESDIVNVVYLTEIYRQSRESDIVLNAHRVNDGEYPIFKNKDTDMFYINCNTQEDVISQLSSLVSYRLENFAKFDILKDLQILTPMRKTALGSIELNSIIQNILNPASTKKIEKKFGDKLFREGDKVMQIVNNYDKKFCINGEHFTGIYNGDIGYIKEIDLEAEEIVINFDEKEIIYDFEEMDELELAYCTTIHKSQGSEFDYVILPIFTGYQKLFTRNLLYTAMTRAKKMLIIVGNKKVLNYMVDNIESKNRKTGLKYKITEGIH